MRTATLKPSSSRNPCTKPSEHVNARYWRRTHAANMSWLCSLWKVARNWQAGGRLSELAQSADISLAFTSRCCNSAPMTIKKHYCSNCQALVTPVKALVTFHCATCGATFMPSEVERQEPSKTSSDDAKNAESTARVSM